jgi:hypothetical protein
MDQDQEFEELAKRWPDLMQKSEQDYVGVGHGWHHIIDALFGMLSYDVERARQQLNYLQENPGAKYARPIHEVEAELATALEKLPTIVQIKEKLGGLRVYTNGATPEHRAYIDFAAAMASRTCEICGSPGTSRNSGWIKTLCEKHHQEREEANAERESSAKTNRSKVSKFSDE